MTDTTKTAIVTGGSGGIGQGISKRLAREGYQVVVHYASNEAAAATVVGEIEAAGGRAVAMKADVANEAEIAELFSRTQERYGDIDLVVVNAGVGERYSIAECDIDEFDWTVAVNFRGAFLTLREAARTVVDNGRIIAISSQLARRPMAGIGVYSATKAAVDALVVALSKEIGSRGITVNSVQPGSTSPGMFDKNDEELKEKFRQMSPFKRLGTPEDCAGVVAFLAGEDGRWITGQCIKADGGATN
ncbi:SDR family oxidoreductase [Rubinisphaera sp. JC750]|uniref:SDR family oxidoreductase n=1 Tax=Rubinisphaera sp. JC750 TaxID=2898658 RepID=UPI001F2A72A2|nr:SDR family oxidoreductase [Rubinisphaera sp. JC750]